MFDRLVRSRRPFAVPRISSLAIALGLHGGVLAIAVFLAMKRPASEVIFIPRGPDKLIAPRQSGGKPQAESAPGQRRDDRPVRPGLRVKSPAHPAAIPAPEVQQISAPMDEAELPPAGDSSGGVCIGAGCEGAGPAASLGSSGEEIIEINPDMRHPAPACEPAQPLMPEQARMMSITGRVVVRYVVHADGSVSDVRSLLPETPSILAEAVQRWLVECRHRPALLDGRPVAVHVTQMFTFRLR
jgi:TonB family protein